MREIKFRYVWQHEETGRMRMVIATLEQIESRQLDLIIPRYGLPIARNEFTGLLDKNRVGIYEGDICDWCSGRVIDYVELKDNDGWKMRDLYNINWWEDVEVIGNIHDNPELLEKP